MRSLLLVLLALYVSGMAHAHEVRPGYLEIRENPVNEFQVRLKQPIIAADGGRMGGLDLKAVLPDACQQQADSVYERADGYLTEKFVTICSGGLGTGRIVVAGLEGSLTDIYATFIPLNGKTRNALLNARETGFRPHGARTPGVPAYFIVGVRHMLGGIDHVLFVLGLLLLVSKPLRLVKVATAFTIAHSITLALSVFQVVQLPSGAVEACIALSVLFLAFELTRADGGRMSLARRRPEVIAFSFGLLHGFGFAGALSEIGLPQDQIASALFLFNLGVEAGQLMVIMCGLLLWKAFEQWGTIWTGRLRLAAGAIVGVGAAYFFAGALFAMA